MHEMFFFVFNNVNASIFLIFHYFHILDNKPPLINVSDISIKTERNATVNVTLHLPYRNEHRPTNFYMFSIQSLDWPDPLISLVYTFELDTETTERMDKKSALLLSNCHEHTGLPQSSAQLIWNTFSLYYNTSYEIKSKACWDDNCLEDEEAKKIFRTVEHAPTCPPLNMKLLMTGTNSMKMSYEALNFFCLHGPATGYGFLLFETRRYETFEEVWNLNATELETLSDFNIVLDVGTLEHEFEGLRGYLNYTLIGFAVNEIGYGSISKPFYNVTDEDSESNYLLNFKHRLFTCKILYCT